MGQVKINVAATGGRSDGGENFEGVTAVHKFSPEELGLFTGYDGTGVPDGIWDRANQRLYV